MYVYCLTTLKMPKLPSVSVLLCIGLVSYLLHCLDTYGNCMMMSPSCLDLYLSYSISQFVLEHISEMC